MENLNFYLNEIIRLEAEYPDSWELIFRYFIKINSVLSDNSTNIDTVINFIKNFFLRVTNNELQSIGNIYFSEIFFNRSIPLKETRYFGNQNFKEIPDFVDKSKLKIHLFEKDPKFETKNISIRGGWLDLKLIKSSNFDI